MDDGGLPESLERAERALARIEQAVRQRPQDSGNGDEALRSKVREAIAELDQLIDSANG
jgi:hypothetical protein